MGENKKDQNVAQTKNDQQQNYGSQQHGRHNREGTSSLTDKGFKDEMNTSMKQPNRLNRQDQDDEEREEDLSDYEMDDDTFDQGRFSTQSQLNEMQDDYMIAKVEGDDEDILGETENAQRNSHRIRKTAPNKDNPQNR